MESEKNNVRFNKNMADSPIFKRYIELYLINVCLKIKQILV